MTRLLTCAGFRADVLPEILAHGVSVELGDHVPFTELFGAGDRGLVAVVVAAAVRVRGGVPLAVEEMFAERVGEPDRDVSVWPLERAAVDALARIDDLALSSVWNDAWPALGHAGAPPADVTQAIRGLVVQCRAAVANGWEVFVVEQP